MRTLLVFHAKEKLDERDYPLPELQREYVSDVIVKDPDTGGDVDVEIWKDQTSGGMFGVDSSFIEQVRDVDIPSPFTANEFFDMRDEADYQEPPILQEPDEFPAAT